MGVGPSVAHLLQISPSQVSVNATQTGELYITVRLPTNTTLAIDVASKLYGMLRSTSAASAALNLTTLDGTPPSLSLGLEPAALNAIATSYRLTYDAPYLSMIAQTFILVVFSGWALFTLLRVRKQEQPLAHLGVPICEDDRSKEVTHHQREEPEGNRCVAPGLVVRVSDAIDWLSQIGPGESLPEQKPSRYLLPVDEAFAMISYRQTWCNTNWSMMAQALGELAERGWQHVWLDVLVIQVSSEKPYVQAHFEESMDWAVSSAAAVWCPMALSSSSATLCRQDRDYAMSLAYLHRPWCFFESHTALVRGVLWCRAPTAFTAVGAQREASRVAKLTIACQAMCFVATGILYYLLLGVAPSVYCFPNLELDSTAHGVEFTKSCGASVALGWAAATTVALGSFAGFVSYFLDLFNVLHIRQALVGDGHGTQFGSGLMYDLGDAAVLGTLLGKYRTGTINSSESSLSASCILGQMITWHGKLQRRPRWWPMKWCRRGEQDASFSSPKIVDPDDANQKVATTCGQLPNGEACRKVEGTAPWLDQGSKESTPGWQVRLSELAALDCTYWLLVRGGQIERCHRVVLGQKDELRLCVATLIALLGIAELSRVYAVAQLAVDYHTLSLVGDLAHLCIWTMFSILHWATHGSVTVCWLREQLISVRKSKQ